jgi:hypothetical protein
MKQGSNGDGSSANFANGRELKSSYGLPVNEHTNAVRWKSHKGSGKNKIRFQRVIQPLWLWHPCRSAGAALAGFRWSFRQKPETTTGYLLPTLRVGAPSNSHFGTPAAFGVHALACFPRADTLKGGHQTRQTGQNENCCGAPRIYCYRSGKGGRFIDSFPPPHLPFL